ncbi:unnamed protein product [Rotaria sp. Silwood1]|nr:unnamed protein product [Rotaria sp. Silwood1]CAF1614770.1 unnamed protein product [Rotaria sp. Silwood1]CAF3785141.1 unnamed protein product [Rotaria sp. Silwood1]CAF4757923.1 unnamed protein product [Rotaria sp. Silwood1]
MAMSDNDFNQLDILSDKEFLQLIQRLYENNRNNSIFHDLDLNIKQRFVKEIFTRLHSFDSNSINLCLKALCLLIQEGDEIDAFMESSVLELLQKLSGLECNKVEINPIDIQNAIEAEKCMSYLIYMSPKVEKFYSASGVADAITHRIKETTETKLNDTIRYFDMRMLFLLTALNSDIRQRIREKFHGLSYLFEIINQIILSKSDSIASANSGIILSNIDIDYLIEILKTLYNLTIDLPNLTYSYTIQEEEEAHLMRLVSILRELLLCYGTTDKKKIQLQNYIINLLTNIPRICYEELLSPIVSEDENDYDEHEGKNMKAINIILQFLDYRFRKKEKTNNTKETLSPVLQLLISMCQSNRTIRKYCRQFIFLSLNQEFFDPSNDEQTLRNKLIHQMINSNYELKTLSAKLLFVLCKENVNCLIKYTGYANAGILLHDLDILNRKDKSNKDEYSSDSDESDSENYQTIIDQYKLNLTNHTKIELSDDSILHYSFERSTIETEKYLIE